MSIPTDLGLAAAACAAGAINSLAGGGTLLTFPALTAVLSPAQANATSTVALFPGSLAGAIGYRRELRASRRWLPWLLAPSLVGGTLGGWLAVAYPDTFAKLIPWLILTATLLFLLQKPLARRFGAGSNAPPHGRTAAGVVAFQLLVGTYGGYFGAGIGILMIASLGLMGLGSLVQVNALKTLLAAAINLVAAAVFVAQRQVDWYYAGVMAVAAVIGGYLGARLGRRLPVGLLRAVVIVTGFGLTAYYFCK